MTLDAVVNFGTVLVSTGYDETALSIVLEAGEGKKLPAVPFNMVWYNALSYGDPSFDPNVEIVRVTNIVTDTLTITRAQEGTAASTKNAAGAYYRLINAFTKKSYDEISASTTVADTASATTWPLLHESATGTLAPKSDASLTYNASTATLASTNFTGALTGAASANVLKAGDSMTGALSITSSDAANTTALSVTQQDTASAVAASITNASTGDGLFITQTGNGVGLHIDNNGTTNSLTIEGTTATDLILLKSGYLGLGVTPTNILSLSNAQAQKEWIENSATDVVGRALTVAAGGTVAGTSISDVDGGNLILQAGLGTGTGASTISFQTGTTLTTGKTLQTMETKMTILGNGNVGIGITSPATLLNVFKATGGGSLVKFNTTNDAAIVEITTGANDAARLKFNTNGNRNWSIGPGISLANTFEFRDDTADALLAKLTVGGDLTISGNFLSSKKIGSFTRDVSTASGNQAVTGVGFKPTAVIFLAGINNANNKWSIGIDLGAGTTNNIHLTNSNADTSETFGVGAGYAIELINGSGGYYQGSITSLDSDGFTIAWVKTGTPTGTLTIGYMAFR